MSINEWISDTLIDLIGESNSDIVDYVFHLAKTCTGESDLTKSLVAAELPNSAATEGFAKQLLARVPRTSAKPQPVQHVKAERAKATADLHDDDDDDGVAEPVRIQKDERSSGPRVRGRNIRKRGDTTEDEEDREELEARIKRAKAGVADEDVEEGYAENADENSEDSTDRDAQERDEFAERLRQKDKERTKRIVEDRSTDGEQKKRRDLANDQEARRKALPEIRDRARQEYLKVREEQRLELLRQEIADEESMFRGEIMTEKEIKDL
ncbi:hypothetical protein FBU59_004385, partial [Linderina macrospora]